MDRPTAATALASADRAQPELAAEAVSRALARTGADIARCILLFLSNDFARHAREAVAAASRAGQCLQVAGCTGAGVFTEEDWILDRPAACALVLTQDDAPAGAAADQPRLTLALSQAAGGDWLAAPGRRFGLIATDPGGHDGGRVWGHGKLQPEGHYETTLGAGRLGIGVSRGIRALSTPLEITHSEDYELLRVGGHAALDTLLRELPLELRALERLPCHTLFAAALEGEAEGALEQGRYTLVPIIASGGEARGITLAAPLAAGRRIVWCIRQPLAAERDTHAAVEAAAAQLAAPPAFAVMLSCLGRGPYFFDGADRDLQIVRSRYPGLPIVGAYGAGQIAPTPMGTRVLHNSAVIALAGDAVQS